MSTLKQRYHEWRAKRLLRASYKSLTDDSFLSNYLYGLSSETRVTFFVGYRRLAVEHLKKAELYEDAERLEKDTQKIIREDPSIRRHISLLSLGKRSGENSERFRYNLTQRITVGNSPKDASFDSEIQKGLK